MRTAWEKVKILARRAWVVLNTDVKDLPGLMKMKKQDVSSSIDSLGELAQKNKAIGIKDLIKENKCSHDFVTVQQVWVKIAPKKFELRNQERCKKCSVTKIVAMG